MQIFALLTDFISILLGLLAAWAGNKNLQKSISTKKSILRFSRGSVLLQKTAFKHLSDGKLSVDEISEYVTKFENELTKSDNPKETKDRMRRMIKRATNSSVRNRLLQEIIYESLDEFQSRSKKN